MRVLLFLCVSVALLYVVTSDHKEGHHDNDKHNHTDHEHHNGHKAHDDKHDHKHDHHKKGKHHHHHNESTESHKIAQSNYEFAYKLFRQVAADHPSENIFFSPVSISTAFAMLSLGARSQTHHQIIEGLNFNISEISEQEIHAGFQNLLHILNEPDSELQLNSGNALFISKNWKLLQKFLEDVKNFYEAEAFSTDFHNSEEAKSQINSYVEKKTNGKIVDLLSSVDPEAAVVLINYIYFRGKWQNPFQEESTKEGDFHVDEKTVLKVPMMFRNGRYRVVHDRDLGCHVVEIPYKGNASAWFILPDEGKFKAVEEALGKPTSKKWLNDFSSWLIKLWIPKFSISTTLDLVPEFKKLGVTDLFSDEADLSGITGESTLKVSKAVHRAELSVDERGTEAAGATVVEAVPLMLPPSIKFNKPFFLTIYHIPTRSLSFLGKIVNPLK
ncbi:alpha-1-antitrypsin [Bombina bombina]|uniref:alpha-1-antitrypsin n=1 Tax=Bombina bombina TaxID=8345 RepID=UPI00235A79A4|nr:alpha-1-antitrypsin [Bombina bombina]XP_053553484.1 alpha-1-antitrypsin [Bombina bombina]